MKYISSLFLVLSMILISCSEDDAGMNLAPNVTVADATGIYRTGATLTANISNSGDRRIVESGFIYSTTSDFENMSMEDIRRSSACVVVKTENPVASGSMTQNLTSLRPNTSYYYSAYVSSGYSIERTEVKTFATAKETEPIFSELEVSNLTINSCTLSFGIIDLGGEDNVQTLELWYQEIAGGSVPTTLDKSACERIDASGYSANLRFLNSNTRYAVCAYVSTTSGREGWSKVVTFTTENINVAFGNVNVTSGEAYFRVACAINTSEEVVAEGVFYSRETGSPSESNLRMEDANVNKNIDVTVDNLDKGLYYVRPYAIVRKNDNTLYVYGNSVAVTINGSAEPLAQFASCTAGEVTSSSITVSASLVGSPEVKEKGFCYIVGTGTPTIADNTVAISSGKPFTATLYSLDSNTDYTIRAYAVTESGISYSAPVTQRTNMKTPSSDDNVFPGKN